LRLIENYEEESPTKYLTLVQIDAVTILVDILMLVANTIDLPTFKNDKDLMVKDKAKDDDKRLLIIKRERQLLHLAIACLKVLVSMKSSFPSSCHSRALRIQSLR
jgi:hypothetical protein